MKKVSAACALACAFIAVSAGAAGAQTTARDAARAGGPITFGVADDTGKFADDGGAWFDQQLKGANLTEERWTVSWTGGTTINELPFLQRAAPQAQEDGIKVELALYGRPASNNDPTAFCAWAANVATTVSQWGIHDYIVWNEPNTALYWSPQNDGAPAKYEALLAACYDSIHAADPAANVIGFGLSPRKGTSTQTSPLAFLSAAGAAYKASGRTKPIMDMLSVHPYPNPNHPVDGPDVGYGDTTAYGIPNLDRVKQAVYDAFNGTAQPTTQNGLMLVLDEVGWQTDTTTYSQYIHGENVQVVSEAQQAQYLQLATAKYFACDPTIATVNWFLLVDESTRNGQDANGTPVGGGWQSGLLTAGGQGVSTPKQAYAQLAGLWAKGRAACSGAQINWKPAGAGGPSGGAAGGGSAGGGAPPSFDQMFGAYGLQSLFPDLSGNLASLKTLFGTMPALFSTSQSFDALFSSVNLFFQQLQSLLGNLQSNALASFGVIQTTSNSLSNASALSALGSTSRKLARTNASMTVLAKGSTTVAAGKPLVMTLKASKSKSKLKTGNLFAVLVVRNAAGLSTPSVISKQIGVVQAKAAKPKKKTRK